MLKSASQTMPASRWKHHLTSHHCRTPWESCKSAHPAVWGLVWWRDWVAQATHVSGKNSAWMPCQVSTLAKQAQQWESPHPTDRLVIRWKNRGAGSFPIIICRTQEDSAKSPLERQWCYQLVPAMGCAYYQEHDSSTLSDT